MKIWNGMLGSAERRTRERAALVALGNMALVRP
jgi:hypothetical protein